MKFGAVMSVFFTEARGSVTQAEARVRHAVPYSTIHALLSICHASSPTQLHIQIFLQLMKRGETDIQSQYQRQQSKS
jgi:hypothetical protein